MVIYADESGSINNRIPNNAFFVIALIHVTEHDALKRAYKRFVSSNYERLKELDQDKHHPKTGAPLKKRGKMFRDGAFYELKGSQFDKEMKQLFVDFFSRKKSFEIFYIKISNHDLGDQLCENPCRVYNYALKTALEHFIRKASLPAEDCVLHLDERNERKESRHFLEDYLNTELSMNGTTNNNFAVGYFDSSTSCMIQIADVFANLYYSHLQTDGYWEELQTLKYKGILREIYEFPARTETH
jgi:hypothetical protein